MITREVVAAKLAAYLNHQIPLATLVDWAENALMAEDFDEDDIEMLADIVARLGVADVRKFGLVWEDCDSMLSRLGFSAHLTITASGC